MAENTPGKNVLNLTNAGKLTRIATAGTPIGMLRRAADAAANPFLDKKARQFAKNRATNTPAPGKKLMGISFWLVVGVALFKDFMDVLLNFTVFFIILVIPLSFLISFGVFMYLYLQDVKMDSRKMATMIIGFALDAIPLLGILPTFTITLFVIRFLENRDAANAAAQPKAPAPANDNARSRQNLAA